MVYMLQVQLQMRWSHLHFKLLLVNNFLFKGGGMGLKKILKNKRTSIFATLKWYYDENRIFPI